MRTNDSDGSTPEAGAATSASPSSSWIIRSSADIGRALADLRHQQGLSQEEFSRQAGVPRSYLARLETGMTVVMVERMLRLLRRLGAEVTVTKRGVDA